MRSAFLSSKEYRDFAAQCLRWAARAKREKRGTFGNSGLGCDDTVAGQIANLSRAFRPDARRSAGPARCPTTSTIWTFLHLPGLARPSNQSARSVIIIIFLAAVVTGWIVASLMPAPPNGLLLSSLLAGDRHPT